MERNKYELQREVLARKYETILKDFEDTNDDRRIAAGTPGNSIYQNHPKKQAV